MARLLGVDLPRNKKIRIALRAVYGIGPKVAMDVLTAVGIDPERSSNDITEDDVLSIRTALDEYTVEGDLRREVALNIKRLKDLGC
jgi:small subunit ribosomal protein S13